MDDATDRAQLTATLCAETLFPHEPLEQVRDALLLAAGRGLDVVQEHGFERPVVDENTVLWVAAVWADTSPGDIARRIIGSA